ncbi:MAG: hypothetical protein ABI130_11085, partial [Leifsonia sp.]
MNVSVALPPAVRSYPFWHNGAVSKRKKHSGGNPARQGLSFGLRAAARDFERWMRGSPSTLTHPVT